MSREAQDVSVSGGHMLCLLPQKRNKSLVYVGRHRSTDVHESLLTLGTLPLRTTQNELRTRGKQPQFRAAVLEKSQYKTMQN